MDTLQKKILCPSILNLSTDNMREEIEKLDATDMDIYHVDIMDGTFVPNFGMSVRELEMIRRITDAGHHKLVDCHMMVMNPATSRGSQKPVPTSSTFILNLS